ncbi:MAG: flagellar biosynthesis protein FliQ [Candidatus Eremiobacterota bacterium]
MEIFGDTYIMALCTRALYLILILSAPMLISALAVGLVISILQATTQVQEQTLGFVPKIVVTFLSMVLCGTWLMGNLGTFMTEVWSDIGKLGPH